jgi:hypothetical protein
MRVIQRLVFSAIASLILMGCGDGGDSSSNNGSPGGVCISLGSTYNCQGRICTKSGNGVICPDGQFCPVPINLSVTSNPVCAPRN